MELKFDSEKPIFQQIAEGIEDAVLTGGFPEEGQIPSITEFSLRYTINPATALKGVNLLVEEQILYKKRGVGMFVSPGARERVRQKRLQSFTPNFVAAMVAEAHRLELTAEELSEIVQSEFSGEKADRYTAEKKGVSL
ncbi:GntR family transcriptional regulator [Neglectibacter caecimuris]|uniref:GntR family transcriptional regulator n=1 Tax=Neglectibacter caecimuris TaxID=3093658 RepID=UPI002AC8EA2F|nr:GntR family transcriptional regulator [Neglectibacter sp. M00184]